MPSVTVNLDVTVDASGSLTIFGEEAVVENDYVDVSGVTLSADTLFKGKDDGLIWFWEPSTALGDISGALFSDGVTGGAFTGTQAALAASFHTVLASGVVDSYDATNTAPFSNTTKYSNNKYRTHDSFGDLVLAYYADQILGHIDSTAIITNDEGVVSFFNSEGAGNAGLGAKLAAELFSAVQMDRVNCTRIVKQVLGQDASRAMGEDNNALSPDECQALEFKEGDTIFVKITIKKPVVNVGVNKYNFGTELTNYGNKDFLLKIKLGA
jgi:hypothetical protein